MAKRKSSKTKAQNDPTVSEDKTSDPIDAKAEDAADLIIDGETLPADGETQQDAAELSAEDSVMAGTEGDDTLTSEEGTTPEIVEDSQAAESEDGTEDAAVTEAPSDSVVVGDGQDSLAGTEGADSIADHDADADKPDENTEDALADAETLADVDDNASALQENDTAAPALDEAVDDRKAEAEPAADTRPTKIHPTDAPYASPPPEQKPRTVFPMIVGGFVAALLGFVAARTGVVDSVLPGSQQAEAPAAEAPPPFDDSALTSAIDALTTRLNDLESTVSALPTAGETPASQPAPEVDLSKIEEDIKALSDQVKSLESQPVPEAPVPTEALDAALAELRQKASEQQAEIDKLLADQQNQIATAEKAAEATLARTAMTSIQTALNTGTPFEPQLSDLQNTGLVSVPDDLTGVAADGVPSLASLQESYPEAARAALYSARDAEKGSGLEGFLLQQLGARAVEPKEGSDTDAILSRMEAALRAGDLETVLAEAQALPEPAQAAMASWIEQAQTRHNAVSAANALAESLSAL